jgi:hypothetical protein
MGMAAKKNVSSVKGAEAILEALDIYREELVEQTEDPKVCASVYFRELFLEFSTNPIR